VSLATTTTEPSYFGGVLRAGLAVMGVAIFFTAADNYAFRFLSGPPPLHLVVLFVAAAGGLILLELRTPQPLLHSPVALWIAYYFVLTVLWAIFMKQTPVVQDALNSRLRSVALLVAFAVIFSQPAGRRAAILAVVGAVVFASVLNVAELAGVLHFSQGEELRVGGRSAGLYVNPNGAGLAIVFGLAVTLVHIPERWRVPLLIVGALGVVATFSRGAQVCFAALVLVLVWRRQVPIAALVAVAIGGSVLATLQADAVLDYLLSNDLLNENTWARLHFAATDSGRGELARVAWQMFTDSPVVGKGLGATIDWDTDRANSSHNMFLNLAGDHGILGLVAFPALGAALVVRNLRALPFAAVLMLAGLVSHNLLEDRSTLLVIALAASFASLGDEAASEEESPRCAA
jgi:hypothetical protein